MIQRWTAEQKHYLIATHACLTPAEQAEALDIPLKRVWQQLDYLRHIGALPPSLRRTWSDAENERARQMVNDGKSAHQIAQALGRTANAVLNHLTAMGINPRREIMRADGMGAAELAESLGVRRDTVVDWIRRGQLRATRRKVDRQVVYSISYTSILRFIAHHGGYLPLRPTFRWASPIHEARAAFQAKYIKRAAAAQLLCIACNTLDHWEHRGSFLPSVRFMRACYYERSAMRQWLLEHPKHQTTAARKEFGL